MKTTKLYQESAQFQWFCKLCGKPNFLRIDPNGVHDLNGKRIAGKSAFKKGLVVRCNRTHMAVPNCSCRRKVFIDKAVFAWPKKKFVDEMHDLHEKRMKEEDKERKKHHEAEIRKKVKEEVLAEIKEKKKQRKLFKMSLKVKKKKKRKKK